MKRTMLAAVIGGVITLMSGVFTVQAAPVSAVQVGKTARPAETLVQKTEWRGHHRHYRHRHYGHRHYRPHYGYAPRRHYYRHHAHRPHYWQHRSYYGTNTYRHHRRHYH